MVGILVGSDVGTADDDGTADDGAAVDGAKVGESDENEGEVGRSVLLGASDVGITVGLDDGEAEDGAADEGGLVVEGTTVEGAALVGAAVHASVLHSADSDVAGHAMATPIGAEETPRVRQCDPRLQAAEQLLQVLHSLMLQSTHTIPEQATLLDSDGHAAPPPYATSLTERQCSALPDEQNEVQVAHTPHAVTEQSMGHGNALHARSSVVAGHAMPPAEVGTLAARVRC